MNKIIAFVLGFVQTIMLFFGMLGSDAYEKQTGLQEAVEALTGKDEILAEQYIGTVSDENWVEDEFSLEDMTILTKEKDKDFVVLNIADTHFADYDERAFFAFAGETTIRRMVAEIKPDLITLSGDLVCTESTVYAMKRLTDLMESFGIPWAPVFGNHDGEGNCDLNYLADIMMKAPNCLFKKGDSEMGVGNYIIGISETDENGTQNIAEAFIMMDSHSSQPNERQHRWYAWAADGIQKLSNGKAEVSLLMHIPIPEYQYAYDAAWDSEANAWKDAYHACGEKNEEICCERADNIPVQRGFFDLIKQSGNTKYVFCGHEHLNNFSIEYEGVRLTYMLKLGWGSGYQFGFNGGTVITVGNQGISEITHRTYSYGIPLNIVEIK